MGGWGSKPEPTKPPVVETTTTQRFTSYVTSAGNRPIPTTTNDDSTINGNTSTAVERLPTTPASWNEGVISTVEVTPPTSSQREFTLMIIIYVLLAVLLLSIVLNTYLLRKLRSSRPQTQTKDSENHTESQRLPSDTTYDVMYKAKPQIQSTSYDTVNIRNDATKHNQEDTMAKQNGIFDEAVMSQTISPEGYSHIGSNTDDTSPDNLYNTLRTKVAPTESSEISVI